jgi:3-deoxy-D-manno-octulosonic-acid transferase
LINFTKKQRGLIKLVYNLSIYAYQFLVWIFGFFNEKAAKMISGRIDWEKKTSEAIIEIKSPIIWFHCASLGEFEQGRPVIEAFAEQLPEYKIVLTFFSPSGYEIRKNYDKAHIISYLPFDTITNANKFLSIIKPKIAIFVKYEFWHNYLNLLDKNNTPTYLISANFRENQLFFKPYGTFFKNILFSFDHIFVQNIHSQKILQSIDFQENTIAGDTRFDRVFSLSKSVKPIEIIKKFKDNNKLFVLGSAWEADIDFLISFFNSSSFEMQIVIAPHEIKAAEIENWQAKFLKKSVKYSEVLKNESALNQANILFIDNIGLLSSIYQYADFCWIGGAFGSGLHNILEAATFGKPIFFGNKNYTKFQEAMDLIELEVAFPIAEYADFEKKINSLMKDNENYTQTCERAKNYVSQNTGATNLIINKILESITPLSQ